MGAAAALSFFSAIVWEDIFERRWEDLSLFSRALVEDSNSSIFRASHQGLPLSPLALCIPGKRNYYYKIPPAYPVILYLSVTDPLV